MLARLFASVFLILIAAATTAGAQTADEVVTRYLAATGGADKWAAVKTVIVSSRSQFFSSDVWIRKPQAMRHDAFSDEATHTDTRRFDGTTGWRLKSLEGESRFRQMSADEIAELRADVDWMFELVDYKAKGTTIKPLGTAMVGTQPADRLEVTRANGAVLHVFVDQKSGLEVQRIRWGTSPSGESEEFVSAVGDYKRVGDLLLPHAVGPATRTYEINGTIADDVFQKAKGL